MRRGNFLDELDSQRDAKDNVSGVVNGASFNYAEYNDYAKKQNSTHQNWDSKPVTQLDLTFRNSIIDNIGNDKLGAYKPPKDSKEYLDNLSDKLSKDKKSMQEHVEQREKPLKQKIRRYR